jgi:hypothetical protein
LFSCEKDETLQGINVDSVIANARPELISDFSTNKLQSLALNDTLLVKLDRKIGEEQLIFNNEIEVKVKTEFQKVVITRKYDSHVLSNFNYALNSEGNAIKTDFTEMLEADRDYDVGIVFRYFKFNDTKWEYLKSENDEIYQDTIRSQFTTVKFGSDISDAKIENIQLVKEITLENNIFPKIQLNYPVDKEFLVSTDGHKLNLIRARIKNVRITSNGNSIEIEQTWSSDYEFKVLPMQEYTEQTNYKCNVLVEFEEKLDGEWFPFVDSESIVLVEEKSIEFTIGNLDNENLIERYLDATYPLDRQMNFYREEYDRGYFQFVIDPKNISSIDANNIEFKFFSLPDQVELASISAVVNSSEKTIWFDMPENLENGKLYQIQMFSNSTRLYSLEFRVSRFDRFNEKLDDEYVVTFLHSSDDGNGLSLTDYPGFTIYYDEESKEGFDFYELIGQNDIPLIQRRAVLEKWDWYETSVYKYIYDNYPIIPEAKLTRDQTKIGIPPVNPINIAQLNASRKVSDEEIKTGVFTNFADIASITIKLPEYWKQDYLETQKAIRDKYDNVEDIDNEMQKNIYSKMAGPIVGLGNYPVLFEYKLPGKNIITSSKEINIINKFSSRYSW